MFTRPYVPRFFILVPVSHVPQSLCYPEMFPSPVATQTYITQSLCSPVPMFPIFPSPYVSQSLCSPVHLFSSPYRCSPVPMLPSPYVPQLIHQSLCSPLLFHRSVFHSLCSPTCSPVPIFPKHVPQFRVCSPVPMYWGTKGLGNIWTWEYLWGT